MAAEQTTFRHRVELVAASVHWTHCEDAIEFEVTQREGGRATVAVRVLAYGDYWEPYPSPRVAEGRFEGRLELSATCYVALDEGAPIDFMAFDIGHTVRAVYLGPGLDECPPAFCESLLRWATGRYV
jgi:hypothetical protein